MLTNLQNILLALIAGLLIGVISGYKLNSVFTAAGQTEAIVEQRKEDVQSVSDMQKTEAELGAGIRNVHINLGRIKDEIKRGPAFAVPTPTIEIENQTGVCPDQSAALAVRTVGLLNAARTNQTIDPAAWRDGEGAAATNLGIDALIENDLQIVELYHELARRHDALVEWVEKEVFRSNAP